MQLSWCGEHGDLTLFDPLFNCVFVSVMCVQIMLD